MNTTLSQFDPAGAADLPVGSHVYTLAAPGRAIRWTVTSHTTGGEHTTANVISDTGTTSGIASHAPHDGRWWVDDPDGDPAEVAQIAGHVVQVRVVVPLDVAPDAESAKAAAESMCGTGSAWVATPYRDSTHHVFDSDGFPIQLDVPDHEVVGHGGIGGFGVFVFDGTLNPKDCNAEILAHRDGSARPGPSPHAETRLAVIEALSRGETYREIAETLGVSRQRVGQIVSALRRYLATVDLTERPDPWRPPSEMTIGLAQFAVADTATDPVVREAAERFVKRALPLR